MERPVEQATCRPGARRARPAGTRDMQGRLSTPRLEHENVFPAKVGSWRQAVGHPKGDHCSSSLLLAHTLPEAFPIHGQDVGMVGQPVQQGPGQLFAAEHLRPLGKVQIGGHEEGLPLVALGCHLEEELGITGRASTAKTWSPAMVSRTLYIII
jgi:hypothetical protein